LRTKDGKEIDFLITKGNSPYFIIEVKWADGVPSDNFRTFGKFFPSIKKVQLVKELKREKTFPDGLEIRLAHNWLSTFRLEEGTT